MEIGKKNKQRRVTKKENDEAVKYGSRDGEDLKIENEKKNNGCAIRVMA